MKFCFKTVRERNEILSLLYSLSGISKEELKSLRVRDFQGNHNYGWVYCEDRTYFIQLDLKRKLERWIASHKLQQEELLFCKSDGRSLELEQVTRILSKLELEEEKYNFFVYSMQDTKSLYVYDVDEKL